jgi:serine/threonine-protein kinase RsbT
VEGANEPEPTPDVATLLPMVRRIVLARVGNHPDAEDVVQETLAKVLAAESRVDPHLLEAYAITTARNVIASLWRQGDVNRRNLHRVHEPGAPDEVHERVLAQEEQEAMASALARLDPEERDLLWAHDVSGEPTRALADERGNTAGAVAAQLHRTRARLRVEYLLALEHAEAPTDRCRPVLVSLSLADRRRQRDLDAARHLLECELCARLADVLTARAAPREDEVHVRIDSDPDIVRARQAARDLAQRAGLAGAVPTLVATAVSEIARNIVRFADHGSITIELVDRPRPALRIVARDSGPGIPDVEQALVDGFSTYGGLGLGLPGAQRIMDEFAVETELGRGTTVTMSKWIREGRS